MKRGSYFEWIEETFRYEGVGWHYERLEEKIEWRKKMHFGGPGAALCRYPSVLDLWGPQVRPDDQALQGPGREARRAAPYMSCQTCKEGEWFIAAVRNVNQQGLYAALAKPRLACGKYRAGATNWASAVFHKTPAVGGNVSGKTFFMVWEEKCRIKIK